MEDKNIIIILMDSISTTFDKMQMNQCADRCIFALAHGYFTPDETRCFQRCVSNAGKLLNFAQ